jgi:hypothetical protein
MMKFDLTLKDVNRSENTVILLICHVPPEKPCARSDAFMACLRSKALPANKSQ